MKLFQQMLVATAAAGLFAPVASQASDLLNVDSMNDYSRSKKSAKRINSKTFVTEVNEEIANLNGRIDGLEAQQNNFEASSFSDTTTLDGKAVSIWVLLMVQLRLILLIQNLYRQAIHTPVSYTHLTLPTIYSV